MQGFYAPFVPGWDCHGLPIETQLLKDIRKSGDQDISDTIKFREQCKEYALKYVDIHRKEFIRLGCFADWEEPYLTLDPVYESKIASVFGDLAEKGYVYRGLKPIHWCPHCETALAEAELEYEDEKSPSIYVKFQILTPPRPSDLAPLSIKDGEGNRRGEVYFIIWTTTPWTLPSNVAIAIHPNYDYVVVKSQIPNPKSQQGEIYILAEGLLASVQEKLGWGSVAVLKKVKGRELEGIICKHPFIEREVPVVLDTYVTLEQGSGCVHIAPGHGIEDYQVGLKYKLPIVMPIDAKGHFDQSVPAWIAGQYYDKTNKIITEKMHADGTLLKLELMQHSYPHCWRCKKPVIFRATEQWFVSVDHKNMREEALRAIKGTKWFPAWGENRITGMVEQRPDWCISRQRSWGVPIPAFYCRACGKVHITGVFNKAVVDLFGREGSNAWFAKDASEILPKGTKCECGGAEFNKETDILDVWFESGVSHAAVLETRDVLSWPADLYLEGSDQHRGWFQSSLLTAIGYKGRAPYDAVLTHGFTVDDKGKKMSKSLGNVIDPQNVVKKYGADVLRLWVASTDFRNDMAASDNILKQVQDAYLKIRNTCRFLLSNLGDYSSGNRDEEEQVSSVEGNRRLNASVSNLLEIDRWILLRLNQLIEKVTAAYESFEYHLVYHALYDFCVTDLSAYYLDMSKDRLYCDAKDSQSRLSAQYAINEILNSLVRLMAPILSFTAEDIYGYMKSETLNSKFETNSKSKTENKVQNKSIFLLGIPKANKEFLDEKLEAKWNHLLEVREEVYRVMEVLRAEKKIKSSVEGQVDLYVQGNTKELLNSVKEQLPMFFIVSQVNILDYETAPEEAITGQKSPNLKLVVRQAEGKKCERCWMWSASVGSHKEHLTLCTRCIDVVSSAAP
jgi:isoleucyl-tRNA synthetase